MIPARHFVQSKFISLGFLAIGIFLLMQVILPLISFQIWTIGQSAGNQILVSPSRSSGRVLGVSVQNKDNFPIFVSSLTRNTEPTYSEFQLSVPKLKIESSTVYVDSNDLSKGLVQLPGSAMPGGKGNVFITGHSSLNTFIPGQNAIFAKLTDLKKGDELLVEAANSKFVYKVVEIKVVDPSDLSVIPAPDEQGRYISLMTCVPPGLNYKRLVVLGKI
ncbi:MAG: class E sortase [Candidatus Daviesbacteria bacterium]|nr:class E sortase [Candidatus Daviesbacteria bacterium]